MNGKAKENIFLPLAASIYLGFLQNCLLKMVIDYIDSLIRESHNFRPCQS